MTTGVNDFGFEDSNELTSNKLADGGLVSDKLESGESASGKLAKGELSKITEDSNISPKAKATSSITTNPPDFLTEESGLEREGLVIARGTREGLVLRLDGRVDPVSLKVALKDFMNSRQGFLSGQDIALEWSGNLPPGEVIEDVILLLKEIYDISVKSSRLLERQNVSTSDDEEAGSIDASGQDKVHKDFSSLVSKIERQPFGASMLRGAGEGGMRQEVNKKSPSLFDGVEALKHEKKGGESFPNKTAKSVNQPAYDSSFWDDPDCRVIYATLRSGQKIESEHSVLILGDVNSGAEVISGGDIIVLGTLRGVAHAGAYEEAGGGRVIFALHLEPTQLRIGSVISRGAPDGGKEPEIARIEGTLVTVEGYQARNFNWGKRR